MKQKVLNTIKKYKLIEDREKILLGVSGGPDSISMLDILKQIKQEEKIKFEIVVAHINHQIREEAIEDEKYVQNYCEKNNIKCYVKRIDGEYWLLILLVLGMCILYGFMFYVVNRWLAHKFLR